MEEILASIRRIIADDDIAKPTAAAPATPLPRPAAMPPRNPVTPSPPSARPATPPPAAMDQHDVDAMMAGVNTTLDDAEPAADDVLDLTEQMASETEAPSFQTIDGQSDVFFADALAQSETPPRAVEEPPEEPQRAAEEPWQQPAPQATAPDRPLMSSTTSAAVDSAFNALAQTVLVHNARTLEDLVREMLRPLLKSWLDDNLPGMVERIVKAEIERVSRGRG
jgi:cell pole-organizing protein PopZ